MDAEEVLKLFESYWFEQQIFTNQPQIFPKTTAQAQPQNDTEDIENNSQLPLQPHHVRSLSDKFSSQTSSQTELQFQSPKSVLPSQKLQSILSGKEVTTEDQIQIPKKSDEQSERRPPISSVHGKRRNRVKSMSDLEFEELKGFIDLGFVFNEEDKNSRLVSVIPGLQRLGKRGEGVDGGDELQRGRSDGADDGEILVSRPYLSEAWGVVGRKKEVMNPLMNWRVPANFSSEIAMKDNLRNWAHTVASTVSPEISVDIVLSRGLTGNVS
ncbi:hypothetical protein Sjap_026164 [Stephania japonica]|uniref:Uncharacterized protein n=1 Tax=Stephania japonica TaxID=461633 RepID=A0AAP0HET6_9MAGN